MTDVREPRVAGRPENESTDDRAAALSVLSRELAERLGKHPLPPRTIMPMAQPPSHRRWLACGLVSGIGIGAAVVALVLPDVPWKYLERKGDALKGAAEEVAAMPLSPIATATAQAASPPAGVPAVARTEPSAVQATQPREQAMAVPAAPEAPVAERELTSTEVYELQARLRALQFDPGPLDGLRGPLTRAAIRRFQESRGQRATGDINLGMLIQLRQSSVSAD